VAAFLSCLPVGLFLQQHAMERFRAEHTALCWGSNRLATIPRRFNCIIV